MQKLQFEEKWDKTISDQDRSLIEDVFSKTKSSDDNEVDSVTLWQATNHKGELLVTVLIHNRSDGVMAFKDTHVQYETLDQPIAEKTFTIPSLKIPAKTSMPWTFIFPNVKLSETNLGNLKIDHFDLVKE